MRRVRYSTVSNKGTVRKVAEYYTHGARPWLCVRMKGGLPDRPSVHTREPEAKRQTERERQLTNEETLFVTRRGSMRPAPRKEKAHDVLRVTDLGAEMLGQRVIHEEHAAHAAHGHVATRAATGATAGASAGAIALV